jgi:hypothetical protein
VRPDDVLATLLDRFRATDPAPVFGVLWDDQADLPYTYIRLSEMAHRVGWLNWSCEPLAIWHGQPCCFPDYEDLSIARSIRAEAFEELPHQIEITITSLGVVLVHNEWVDELVERRFRAGALTAGGIAPPLRERLEEALEVERRWRLAGGHITGPPAAYIAADRSIPFETLLAVIATAAAAGIEDLGLAVRRTERFQYGMIGRAAVTLTENAVLPLVPRLTLSISEGGFTLADAAGTAGELDAGGVFRQPVESCRDAGHDAPTICLGDGATLAERYDYRQLYNRLVEIRDYGPWQANWPAEPSITIAAAPDVDGQTLLRTSETARFWLAEDRYDDDASFGAARVRESDPLLFPVVRLVPLGSAPD